MNDDFTFVNLTPHAVVVVCNGAKHTFPASGDVARVGVTTTDVRVVCGINISQTTVSDTVDGLPDPVIGTYYIVSAMVRTHPSVAWRKDVLSPAGLVRDADGNVVGASGFTQN